VIQATQKPVNVLAAGPFAKFSRAELAGAGAARISLGSALARVTHRVIHDIARTMFVAGDFTPLTQGISGQKIDKLLGRDD